MVVYTASFVAIDLGIARKKTATFTSFRDIAPFSSAFTRLNYSAVSCYGMLFLPFRFFLRLFLHMITAAAHHRGGTSRDRALIATRPVCFDHLTPQAAMTSYVIGSAIRAKKQLFHVKHRFLQCFSLEFYLLFALSLLPHCLMLHLFRYWFNMNASVYFIV